MAASTRERMVQTASRLFQRDGYHGTSWRRLVEEAGTPWGSVHHHFPGGKEQLGVAAVELGSLQIAGLISHCFDSSPTPGSAVSESFRLSAAAMEATGFQSACPVGSVALETVPGSEPIAVASRAAFASWEGLIAGRLAEGGIAEGRSRELARLVLTMFEGALLLARVTGTTRPLLDAGAHLQQVLDAE